MASIRLIAGLGNPGREHDRDRHNVGFMFASRLAAASRVDMRSSSRYAGLLGKIAHPAGDIWLLMPQTYMNRSGESVGPLVHFYKIRPQEVLVVHDELDFPPGVVKIKLGGGVAGHNGLKDIAARLGSHDFWRLRIGIGHPGDKAVVPDYVLKSPSPEDREQIERALERSLEVAPLMLDGKMEAAMLKLHTKAA
ncbi:MAG TPA: aminoacyl-tRNA hydrolase [Burkholderiales bacterium]